MDFTKLNISAVFFTLLVFISLQLSGCGAAKTNTSFYEPIHEDISKKDYVGAAQKMENSKKKFKEKDRFLYFFDTGLAHHYAGQYDSSNIRFIAAEQAAEELYTKSISKAAVSLILNDNALNYVGEDYEILYSNLFMALNHLINRDNEKAFVEIRRANEKLAYLEQRNFEEIDRLRKDTSLVSKLEYDLPSVKFANDAFARYLSMHMYASQGKYEDAEIDFVKFEEAFDLQPKIYNFSKPEITYTNGELPVLSIVALTGIGPTKENLALRLRTDKDLNLVQILYDSPELENVEYTHLPMEISQDYYFKFAIPKIQPGYSQIEQIEVFINGKSTGWMYLIENITNLANETFEQKKGRIFLKTVARAITKGLSAHKAKKKADTGGVGGWLKKLAVDVAMDLSENADLRCSRLLPDNIWVSDIQLEPGRYDVRLSYQTADGMELSSEIIPEVLVTNNSVNLVRSFSFK